MLTMLRRRMGRPGDGTSLVYSGTLVVHGHGIAEIFATGAHSEIGRIGAALRSIETETTPLQNETRRVVKRLAVAGLALCAIVAIAYGVFRGHWAEAMLAGVTLAMAMLPEEFPVVLTVFLALGAWRISQAQRAHATHARDRNAGRDHGTVRRQDRHADREPHAGASCSRWPMRKSTYAVRESRLPEASPRQYSSYARAARASSTPFDPMERAIRAQRIAGTLTRSTRYDGDWTLVHEYPPVARAARGHARVEAAGPARYVIAAKGAPEAVADLCRLDAETATRVLDGVSAHGARRLARAGRRRAAGSSGAAVACDRRMTSRFEFRAWSAWPIRCARRCRKAIGRMPPRQACASS